MSQSVDHLDLEALTPWLQARVPGLEGPLTARKFDGGQSNPTFLLEGLSRRLVLRRQPPGPLLPSAHAVDREFRVLRALADTPVPVPQVLALCEDREVIGSLFYLMEFCDGRILWNPALPDQDADTRRAMYDEMVRVLAALHDVDVEAVGLSDYGRPGNYFERQVSRWTQQYRASETRTVAEMETLMTWLAAHLPAEDGQVSLVHGDFRLDNLVWDPVAPRVMAVLDWELSTLGHPLADLAYQCMQLRMPQDSRGAPLRGLGGLDRAGLGIPEEKDYVAAYCARRGLSGIEHWEFYLAFSFFRLAAIAQGVAKRAEAGNASSRQAGWAAAVVPQLAAAAVHIIHEGA